MPGRGHRPRLQLRRRFLLRSERMDDEENYSDADARVRDIERRPRVRKWHMQIEEQKIDHVTVKQSVRQISKNSGQQQGERNVAPTVRGQPNRLGFGRLPGFRSCEKEN